MGHAGIICTTLSQYTSRDISASRIRPGGAVVAHGQRNASLYGAEVRGKRAGRHTVRASNGQRCPWCRRAAGHAELHRTRHCLASPAILPAANIECALRLRRESTTSCSAQASRHDTIVSSHVTMVRNRREMCKRSMCAGTERARGGREACKRRLEPPDAPRCGRPW